MPTAHTIKRIWEHVTSPNCPSRWEHVTSSDLDALRTTHNASDLIGRHNDTREEA